MARPSEYSQDHVDAICEHIANGKSLVSWCAQDDTPGYSTVMRWLDEHSEFRESYARARSHQADFLAEQILQIADTPQVGVKTKTNDKGEVETTEGDMIEHRRLQVDARKWYAAKLAPKKYGDKIQNEHSGPDGGPIPVTDPARPTLTKEEWLAAHGLAVPNGGA